MDFSATSIWTITKMFVRDPAEASRLVLAAGIPLNGSVLMIVLSAVLSSVFSGIQMQFVDTPRRILQMADGTNVEIVMGGPIEQGILAVIMGLVFGYAVYAFGKRFGGTGSLSAIMSVIAMLQIALAVIEAAVFVSFFVLPFMTLYVWLFGVFVLVRGLAFGVDAGHGFNSIGKAAIVVLLAGLVAVTTVAFVAGLTGLGFDLELI